MSSYFQEGDWQVASPHWTLLGACILSRHCVCSLEKLHLSCSGTVFHWLPTLYTGQQPLIQQWEAIYGPC